MTDQAVQPTTAGPGPRPFTGRDRELRALREDIERAGLHTLSGHPPAQSRVLLIAGAPGSGRTALAEEFVRRIADRYPGGVLRARLTEPGGTPVPVERAARDLLVALSRLGTPYAGNTGNPGNAAIAAEAGKTGKDPAEALPVAVPPPGADEAVVAEAFRAALTRRGRTILLLDDVAHSDQVLDLAPENRDCLVVAVSSGPLTDVPDVRPCTLGGLDRSAAVSLLARRAGSSPRITVDPRSAEVLAEQCGGLPAALTLLGGWLGAHPKLSVLEATRMLARSDPGGSGDPDGSGEPGVPGVPVGPGVPGEPVGPDDEEFAKPVAPRPPAPLARAFRLVHDSLSQPLARLLRLLALAPAGIVEPQLASALGGCSMSTAHSALQEYVRLGLLRPLDGDRYQVPGCLDPLLRARLAAHERPEEVLLARARMLERLVRRLQACSAVCEPAGSEARRQLAGMPRALRFLHPLEARNWLAARRPALLSAARMAVAEGGGELDTLARRLVSALARALDAHCAPEEAEPELYRLHELVLRVAERNRMHRERAAALLNLGDLDAQTDRLEDALVRYRTALDAARQGGDERVAGRALESLGGGYAELGDWDRAADWYGRALALRLTRDERADREATARLHGRIGAVHARAERWEEALRAWRASAAAFRRLQDQGAQARALAEAARVQEFAGRPQDAQRTFGQALEVSRGAGDVRLEAALQLRAADACGRAGSLRAAQRHRAAAARLLGPAAARAEAQGVGPDAEPGRAAAEPARAGTSEPVRAGERGSPAGEAEPRGGYPAHGSGEDH
ncbi:ATP-binding protein [Streptomyces smyrnaeus]|uniref:ATP-binding protein n=1 Tax=Streptomyces smyrnaeus TaxID=1387713 RepID=A0ABS3Y6J4_9ACTN|nr:tetratricopeptide repeat protein [Streptomyces smyrnaeus]MBO8203108.1 ATP-binding protein [Streptomyces smyrnaeus]